MGRGRVSWFSGLFFCKLKIMNYGLNFEHTHNWNSYNTRFGPVNKLGSCPLLDCIKKFKWKFWLLLFNIRYFSIKDCPPSKLVFNQRLYSLEGAFSLLVAFQQSSFSIIGILWKMVLLHWGSYSNEVCFPPKGVFHWRLSSMKVCLPSFQPCNNTTSIKN